MFGPTGVVLHKQVVEYINRSKIWRNQPTQTKSPQRTIFLGGSQRHPQKQFYRIRI